MTRFMTRFQASTIQSACSRLAGIALAAALVLAWPGFAAARPVSSPQPAPSAAPSAAQPQSLPLTVQSHQVTVLTGSIFRIGTQTYQIAGIRTPRVQRSQCFYEKRRGRAAQRALRRYLAKGPIEITAAGGTNIRGYPFVHVTVNRVDVRQHLLSRGYALPRAGYDRRNPWCVQP